MADQQTRKLDEKAEQLHNALIWKYQLGSKTKNKNKNKNKKKMKQYKQRRTQTRNW